MRSRVATVEDAVAITSISNQGIEDRVGTFETQPRTAAVVQAWFTHPYPIVVAEQDGEVIAYASCSSYRPRAWYAGIVEHSVYTRRDWRGKGAGRLALTRLIQACEQAGFWKLVSRIFVENTASRALHQSVGFREIGVYEKHGQLDGVWRDVVIVELLLPIAQITAGVSSESASDSSGIEGAKPSDLAALLALLVRADLPQEGIPSALSTTVVARQAGQAVGCAALEIYGTSALLRSVAVDPTYRERGLGQQLVEERLQAARKLGIREVYLLTETAHNYFPRFGFRLIERSAVAPAIHASVEWTSACPQTAQAMVFQIPER
ncbi:MAG TPA: arsinothricin resistance N-acetyltransferase ArsN1 family A [Ktedonobacteraceae bacterium]|nr:arsinothricin resistance N-acetyltransferase ArsN1 family A [Ktedonobacteraceae bacterium]